MIYKFYIGLSKNGNRYIIVKNKGFIENHII